MNIETTFIWKDPPLIPHHKKVVAGDIVQLTDRHMDNLYALFGMTKEEVSEHFSENIQMCADMVTGRFGDNKFTSNFKKITGGMGAELIEDFKFQTGCEGLNNPHIFNLTLPDQFLVTDIQDNNFRIKFLDISLTQQWNKKDNSHLVREYVENLVITEGSDEYFKMGSCW